ncbi:MAG: hypothetical protein DRI56_12685 [Chloroflexota bacterium]|nr:MAG: hypothetical protein DRI56_12685 [Chloroflexota bacterium]
MALILCPECNKEISDRVKACPHCGFPFEDKIDGQDSVQQVEIASVNISPKDSTKTKKIAVGVISVFAILALAFATFGTIKSNNDKKVFNAYIDNLHLVRMTMLDGGSEAESLLNLTAKVWYNSIFEKRDSETDKYTRSGGHGFNDNFNTSLGALFLDSSTLATISKIEDNQVSVETMMKDLQNPPEGLDKSYETVLELYTTYKSLTNLATNPSGSLESFSQNKLQKIDNFLGLFQKLETQIPEKK